jgi:hypothetical protein
MSRIMEPCGHSFGMSLSFIETTVNSLPATSVANAFNCRLLRPCLLPWCTFFSSPCITRMCPWFFVSSQGGLLLMLVQAAEHSDAVPQAPETHLLSIKYSFSILCRNACVTLASSSISQIQTPARLPQHWSVYCCKQHNSSPHNS